jgi:serine protease inhibitor
LNLNSFKNINDVNSNAGLIISNFANEVHIINSIWVSKDSRLSFNPTYDASCLNATSYIYDNVGTINNWCSSHTQGKITSIIDDVKPLVLINAIYFNKQWEKTFQINWDNSTGFNPPLNITLKNTNNYKYIKNSKYEAIRIPYKNTSVQFDAIFVISPNEVPDISIIHKELGYKSTRVQGYKSTRVQGYKSTRVQGYKSTRVQGYKSTRV